MENSFRRNSLKRNFSWNFLGNLIYSLTQWGIIICITRLGSVEMAGVYSLALAITAPIMMFTNLELRTVQATEKDDYSNLSKFVTLRLLSNVVFLIILLLIISLSSYSIEIFIIIMLIAASKIFESWSDVAYGYFQRIERMEFISKSKIIRGIISLILVFFILLATKSLVYSIAILTLVWLATFVIYDSRKLNNFNATFKILFTKEIISIIKLAFPLGIVALVVSLNSNLPKIFIENYLGITMLGFFTTIFYFVMVGDKFVRAVFQAALPRLSKFYHSNDVENFKVLLRKMNLIAFVIGALAILISFLWGEFILVSVYGNEFYGLQSIFILIMVYGMFNYISASLILGLNSLQYFKVQPFLSIIWLISILISSLILIPNYGLFGACVTLIIYSLVRVSSIYVVIKYAMKKEFTN